jgi:hypothetical protein
MPARPSGRGTFEMLYIIALGSKKVQVVIISGLRCDERKEVERAFLHMIEITLTLEDLH